MSNQQRQEVVVKDIEMSFGSMVVFMIKWTIAALPALFILMILWMFFWRVLVGFMNAAGV